MERKKRKWELAEQKGWTVPLVMAQTKKEKKKSQNRITEITFSSSFSRSLKSQLKRKKKFTNNK